MTGIEVANLVLKNGVHLFRDRKGSPGEYDAKPFFSGNKRGWTALDAFSAGAVVAVHNGLNPANRAKFTAFPLTKMVILSFKLIKRVNP